MTIFAQNNLMLRNPRGGVEDLERMHAAQFTAVSCNVRDFAPVTWELNILPKARALGMECWPWGRTATGTNDSVFSPDIVQLLLDVMARWGSPGILNCEQEINNSGDKITRQIASMTKGKEVALCVLPTPFQSVDWKPVNHLPVLIQISPAENDESNRVADCIYLWRQAGFKCVVPMYSSAFGQQPNLYNLQTPYHIYTADDCGGNYLKWKATSAGYVACKEQESDDVELIGTQHGVKATYNRFKTMDPAGANPAFNPDEYDKLPLDQLKAYDKWCRAMMILCKDHDEWVKSQLKAAGG